MKMKFLSLVILAGLLTTSCANKVTVNENQKTNTMDNHNAQTSLDWAGIYSGTEPCADCEGIKSTLKLNQDGTYELTNEYLGVDEANIDTKTGNFNWKDGNTIQLQGFKEGEASALYKIEENKIKHLDMEGNQVKGELADFYVLTKNGNSEVEDKKWQLVELMGQKVDSNPENFYLIFDSKENRLQAKANCNLLNLPYAIEHQFKLTIGEGISTMMACPDGLEDQLKEVFTTTDNLSVGHGTLSLNKGRMAPLARFILVK